MVWLTLPPAVLLYEPPGLVDTSLSAALPVGEPLRLKGYSQHT